MMEKFIVQLNIWPLGEGVTLSLACKTARLLALRESFELGYSSSLFDDYRSALEQQYDEKMTSSEHMRRLVPLLLDIINSEFRLLFARRKIAVILKRSEEQSVQRFLKAKYEGAIESRKKGKKAGQVVDLKYLL